MRLVSAGALVACAAAAKVNVPQGVEMSGGPFLYTNIARMIRGFADSTGKNVPVDSNGWPMADAAQTVVFDARPFPEWQCPTDPKSCVQDPWVWEQAVNGTYYFNISGKATVAGAPAQAMIVNNQTFDPVTYTTAGYMTMPEGVEALCVLSFTGTQRSAADAPGSGFTNLRIMRPGHHGDPDMTWSPEILQLISAVDHVRFMGISGTNTDQGLYYDGGVHHHYLNFTERCLSTDAIWPSNLRNGCWGMPWEDVITLSQKTGKGVWINAPISAMSCPSLSHGEVSGEGVCTGPDPTSYYYQWAQLLKNGNAATGNKGLPPSVPIYLEHGNEVWNEGFKAFLFNLMAAGDECNNTRTDCTWKKNDVSPPQAYEWGLRRHIAKVYELGQTFAAVFGPGSLLSVVRPIFAYWAIDLAGYNRTLSWFNETYGHPSKYFYGLATTGYFGGNAKPGMSIDDVFAEYINSTATQATARAAMNVLGEYWGLKVTAYEAGPGWSVGTTTSLSSYILAQRMKPMRAIVNGDVAAWAAAGSHMDAYNHFALSGLMSEYGMWGHTETMFNISTPKWCGVLDATGNAPYPGCD